MVKELRYQLLNARVDRIYQPDRFSLLLYLYAERRLKKLLISANPAAPSLYLTSRETENPKTPPNFCMMLRKYLLGGRLTAIEQPEYERVFIFTFSVLNEMGDPENKFLIAEIMGRHSNIIFLNQDKKIHDALIHVDHEMSSIREIMPARNYQLPPSQNKRSIDDYAENPLPVLPFLEQSSTPANLEKTILNNLLGFSPLLAQAIVADSGLESRVSPDQLTLEQKEKLSASVYKVIDMIRAGADQPTLYFRSEQDKKPYEFHAFELKALPFRKTVDSLCLAMDVFYSLQAQDLSFNNKKQDIERQLTKQIKHTQKKIDLHQQDFAEGQNAELYKKTGELLTSQLYLVKKAAEEVLLIDYYDPEQKPFKVKLKAHLTPSENAALYFRKYRKARSKLKSATKFLKEDQAELQWLFSLLNALDQAENLTDLKAIQYEFELYEKEQVKEKAEEQTENPAHLLKNALNPGKPGKKSKKYRERQKKQKTKKSKKEQALPPREFVLAEGVVAYAGRNNIQNDYLSLQKARPDDRWFHVKDLTGAHVILQAEDPELIETEHIEKAAQIAAWYSEANQIKTGHGGNIAVDSCLAKHVRKVRGAKPGMVIYDHHRTYFVKAGLPERKQNDSGRMIGS